MLPRFHCQDLGLNGTLDDAQRVALTFLNLWDPQFCMNHTRFPSKKSMSGKKLHQQFRVFCLRIKDIFLVLDSLLPHPGGPFLGFASEKTLAGQDLSFRSDSALYGIFPWRWRHSRSCSDADAPNASKCYEIQEVCKHMIWLSTSMKIDSTSLFHFVHFFFEAVQFMQTGFLLGM